MSPRPITISEAREEILRLEHAYGKKFLQNSLHEVALRWRALTAPNATERITKGEILTMRRK